MVASPALPVLYSDEDIPDALVEELRQCGFQVRGSRDFFPEGTPDIIHLKHCFDRGWVVLTYNRGDFTSLGRCWDTLYLGGVLPRQHNGIVTATRQVPGMETVWANAIATHLSWTPDPTGSIWVWRPTPGPGQSRWYDARVRRL